MQGFCSCGVFCGLFISFWAIDTMREGLRSNSRRPAASDRRMIDLNKDPPIEVDEEDVGAASSAFYSAQGEPVKKEDVSSNAVSSDVGHKSLDVGVTVLTLDVAAAATATATGVEVEDVVARPRTRGRKRKMEPCIPVKEEIVVSDADVGGNVTTESGPRRRGRKRKGEGRSEAGQEAKRLGLEATPPPQTVGRVLRSRTRMEVTPQPVGRVLRSRSRMVEAVTAADKEASPEKEADAAEKQAKPEKKATAAEKHASPDKEAAAGTLVLPGKQPDSDDKLDLPEKRADSTEMQALPEKEAGPTEIQALPEKEAIVYVKQALLRKENHSDMELGIPRPSEEGKTPAEKESQLVTEEGAGAPAEKKLKRGRGRPPKKLGVDGSAKVTNTVSNKAQIDLQKKISMPGAKVVKGQKGVKLHKKVVPAVKLQSQNNVEKKEEGMGMSLKKEKHLLKEQITTILFNAGWTVEYRPRQGRDYNDAVYRDAQGKTHWSVTLAYSKLERKIADGTADEKEVAAFTPIPQDKLCILFRVTKGVSKSKKGGDGSGSSRKRTGGLKGEKLSKRKVKGVNGEQEKSSSRKPTSRKGGSRRPFGLSAREAKVELEDGKLTALSWMIDLGTISPGDKVQYINHERTHEGKISREGICCDCCGQVFSLADFEAHIGSSRGQPLQNICLESGRSLLQCMSESWSKQEQIHRVGFNFVNVENDPDDDTCNICADGGDLICCDGCPSTFHQSCLHIENFPTGDWHCIYCACKYCGIICNDNSKGSNVRDPDDSGYLTCLLCEEKFHVKCMLRKEKKNILVEELQFCSSGCQKLSENLHKLLGVKHELENGFSLSILRRQDLSTFDPLKIECNSKLAMAYAILDECFNPINDERSSTSMIQNICYSCGSNLRRLNYSGFCTFLLEKNDELMAAATIRIHGNQLAEMPFIGTRGIYRRKGMCRRLMTAIETVLSSLDVEKLIIPAISELFETWTKVFGFVPLEESHRRGMKHMSLVLFPHMDLLQKPMRKDQAKGGTAAAGTNLLQTNAKGSPTHDTPAATVGYEPRIVNRLVDSITSETSKSGAHKRNCKDEVFHGLDKYEASLETSKSGTLEGKHVEHCVCAHDDGKEVLQSSQKSAVC